MKTITKKAFVAFLVALGFEKAGTWEDEKLVERFSQVADKIKEEDVPEAHVPLYKAIASGEAKLDLSEEETDAKPAPKKNGKPAPAAKAPVKAPAKAEKPAAKKPAAKAAKAEKPAKAKKVTKPAKEKLEKDKYGATVGSVRAKVNATLTKEWVSQEEIVKKAGCPEDQVKVCLRHGLERQFLEVRRIIEYRVKK